MDANQLNYNGILGASAYSRKYILENNWICCFVGRQKDKEVKYIEIRVEIVHQWQETTRNSKCALNLGQPHVGRQYANLSDLNGFGSDFRNIGCLMLGANVRFYPILIEIVVVHLLLKMLANL